METKSIHEYTEEELLESFYQTAMTFTDNLEALSYAPEKTCQELGDYNTAWELKFEIGRDGDSLLTVWREHLSNDQAAAIADLVTAIASVPTESLPPGHSRALNVAAMTRVEWAPLRESAGKLLGLLGTIRENAARYLGRSV